MKNITLNIIGQSVLNNILQEMANIIKMNIFFYKDLVNYSKNINSDNVENIIITDFSNFEQIEKFSFQINSPIFYLNHKKNNTNIKTKFQKYELINCPFNFKNFIEKINLIYMKLQFADNSKVKIANYIINLNTKEIYNDQNKIKLTEREKDFLIFLMKSNEPKTIKNILETVWGYVKGIETHTVETHVHRLRKKFLNHFNDNNFIKNNKKGYYI